MTRIDSRGSMRAQTLAQAPLRPFAHESDHASDRDPNALDRFLKSERAPSNSVMMSEFDGFLTGIAVGPELARPSEWLSLISGAEAPASASPDEATAIGGALMLRRNEILREIADDAFVPVFWKDRDGKMIAADWAEGFVEAIKLRMEAWKPIFVSRSSAEFLVPILWHCRDKKGRALLGFGPAADDDLVEAVTELIPKSVAAIAAYWRGRPGRSSMTLGTASPGEPRRAGAKIGRNAPCPCGSGQKFKRCCGQVT
jgi:uncharacterized protein